MAASRAVVWVCVLSSALALDPPDLVRELPGYGQLKTKQYAGYLPVTDDGANKHFYWFVEADVGSSSADTPFLVWLNGGPGASSMIGLLAENLGPQKITVNATLVENVDHITKKYHLLAIDNPVGSGFSYTETGAYVTSEAEMRIRFVHGLRGFFALHPEYKSNPLWICGESYAGKYVPNIAYEIAVNATEMPLQGIIVGNGMYNEEIQYQTIGDLAFGEGVIDEKLLAKEKEREQQCVAKIKANDPTAGDFCENITVRWLYTGRDAKAGELFYYDFGMADPTELDTLTASLGGYLNRPDVKEALHVVSSAIWQNADETGPVAKALAPDFTRASAPVIAKLLALEKQVTMYNGVRDGSMCNHIGNLKTLLNLTWAGSEEFSASENKPWPSAHSVMGHVRVARNLRFATVMRTGHLVGMVVPDAYAILLDMVLKPASELTDALVV